MGKRKFSPEQIGEFRAILRLGWSLLDVQNHFQSQGVQVTQQYLSMIRRGKEKRSRNKENETRGRKPKMTPDRIRTLISMTNNTDPPTQRDMATRLTVSPKTVRNHIKKLKRRKVKKPKVHAMTEDTIKKRYARSWALYRMLRLEKWKKVVTSDEAWIYLRESQGKRSVQYITSEQRRCDAEVDPRVNWPKGVMVWVAFSSSGFFKPIFVEKGAKIDAEYYCNHVIRPFYRELLDRYPTGDFLFHQDSAPAHRAEMTLNYLDLLKIPFITPDQWMPSSPDCAPCDYWLWGYIKKKLNKRRVRTIRGLKKAVREELQNIPPEMMMRALKSWSKRCRMIYYNKGAHIENKKRKSQTSCVQSVN